MVALGAAHVIIELSSAFAAVIFNVVASILVAIYVFTKLKTISGQAFTWGFRRDNFFKSLIPNLYFALPAGVLVYWAGVMLGNTPLPNTFWFVLLFYLIWGIVQQFALQNLVGLNLKSYIRSPVPHAVVTSALFSLAHYPDLPLMGLTLLAGFAFVLIYRTYPNIWAVGITHGLLGSLAYYLILGRDPGSYILGLFGVI